MKGKRTSRILSIILLAAMLLTLMPAAAFAEDSAAATWTQVALEDITSEDAIAITMNVGGTYIVLPTKGSGSKGQPLATETGIVDGTELSTEASAADLAWTITRVEGGYNIANANGKPLYVTADNNGVRIGTPQNSTGAVWSLTADGAYLTATDSNAAARYLGIYSSDGTPQDWRCYTSTTGNIKDQSVGFWKLTSGSIDPVDPPEPTISSIADALAASSGEFTVMGVVTLVDGRNIYVQDATGGICLYFASAPTDIALGDTVIGTGTRQTYKGLPELTGASFEKSEGLSLSPKTTTIGALTNADICSYVSIEKLTVTAVSGTNIDVTDDAGASIQIYNAVLGDKSFAVDDVINFTGAVGMFNKLQLRNTVADEITAYEEAPEPPAVPTADVAEGTVTAGTMVTFSCDTEGAVIFYSVDDGTTWTEGNTYTVNETVTIRVKAVKGELSSEIASFTYSVEPAATPIADVLAASEGEFTVKGVVTFVDGKNIYVQDDTGAICLFFSAAPADIALGDTVIGTGTRQTYKGLPELSGASYVKSEGLSLSPKTTTIGALTDADICSYVSIEKLTVTAVNGTNLDVQDENGDEIQIYKAVLGDNTFAVGDRINFTGAVGMFNKLQLRNTVADEITEWTAPVDPGLVILFTNDVHCGIEDGWGYAGLADLKKSLEAEGNTVILVDAGDHVQGGPIGTLSEGSYIIDIMNYVGYDLAIPGNHEFDYSMAKFFENKGNAAFPYISANFMNYADGVPTTAVLDAYKIFEADGKKLAFVGLCTPETITKSTPTYFQDADGNYIYGFCQDTTGAGVYEAAQAAVDAARGEGADYVILVGHLGIDEQSSPWTAPEVIAKLSGVDAIIDGHSHSVIDTELTDKDGEKVLHGQTGTKLANIGMLCFLEDGSLKIDLLPAEQKVQDDADTKTFIEGIKAQYDSLLKEVVAYTPYLLTTKDPDTGNRAVRSAETNLGDLCADAYRNVMGADIAFVNGGGVRADIPAGDITFENILNVHPFGNAACLVEVTGQQILDALEMGARVCPSENGGFLQVAGLTYEIHTSLEPNVTIDDSKMWAGPAGVPYRVQNVKVLNKETGEYEPLDVTKTYKLASHNYMLKNQGDGMAMFGTKNVTILQDEVLLDNKVLINYIQSLPGDGEHEHAVGEAYSDPRGQGRITIVPEEPVEPELVTLVKLEEAPVDGDKVVIHYPAEDKVMSTEEFLYNNKKMELVAVDGAPVDGELTLTEDMAYLTVRVDETGKYSFVTENGRYLLADGTNVQFVAEAGENTLFELETAEDGYFIKCANAQYNGKAQYLEYYGGYFTVYGLNTSSPGIYTFDFYGPKPEPEKTGLVTDLADLTDGAYVVIYNPGNALAMTSDTYQDWYLLGAEATIADNEVTEPAANQIWKVTVNEDGSYTFTQDAYTVAAWLSGNYVELTNNGSYNDATAVSWNLESCNPETSTFYMSSSSLSTSYGSAYIEVYGKKVDGVSGVLVYCGYSTSADKLTEKAYGMQFYLVPAPAEQPPEPPAGNTFGLASGLADGDTVILYNANSGTALGNSLSNYKVGGVALTPADGVITTDDESVAWTVSVNADGTYNFTQGNLVLGGTVRENNGRTYNNIALTEATYTKWTLTGPDAEDFNYYLYLGEMEGGDYDHVYLEYYSGFTLYAQNESGVNKNAYGITFYKKGAEAEVPGGEQPGDDSIKVGTLVTDLSQLTDGATVLIYSPTHKTAASSVPNGDWNIKAVGPVTDTFTAPLVWTVTVNEDGTYKFANGENVLSAWLSGNYVELTVNPNYNAETVSTWNLAPCNAETHTWFVSSSSLTLNDNPCYVEAFLKNGNEVFSGYATSKPTEANYGLQFYLVNPEDASEETDDGTWDGVLNKGSSYVVYNASAEGVLGIPNDMGNGLTNVPATIENEKATVSNGALVFTVADNPGRYYVLEVGGKYLATNNAEELFFKDEIDEYTKWYLTKNNSGYILYNKTANYNGNPVCIEFFSGGFSGWTFKSTDADIFRFNFYPVADGTAVVNGVAQVPLVKFDCQDSRFVEQDYEVKFTLDDLAPEITTIDITYTVGEVTNTVTDYTAEGKTYSFTIPAADLDAVSAESFTLTVQVTNSYSLSYQGVKTVTILDEPFIGKLTPAANAQTLEDKRPVISAEIGNVGENAVFTMTVNDQPVEAVFENGVLSYQAAEDMTDGRYTVIVTVTRADGKSAEKMWSFYVGKAQFQLYFGQLHSHTTYSDGSGTLEAALEYIANIPESGNIQFVAFTDHSNYFDSTSAANPEAALYDVSQMTAASTELWNSYRGSVAAFNAKQTDLLAIAGFEMTWSGGPGHINTFNTPGIVSRNNSTLNDKTNDAGMKAYYALLDQEEGAASLSQFNHPGKTFGNFTDFSYWDAVTDSRIYLVEVGNGEGQIGAGGYYPSYEQYIMALDKGWHVAPTNNQDNHKGRWGNANDARDVIYTDDFSEQGLYNAIRQYRVYATEDKNLEIQYTVNGEPLGTIFSEVPEELAFSVSVYDPDSSDSITKVELVANSGAVAYTWDDPTQIATGLLETTLTPTYSYYFVRVTQADGDLAVTAPVWVGESLKLGISAVECGTSTPVTGEEFTLTTTFFNSEATAAAVKSVVYTVNGSEVIGTDTTGAAIPASSTAAVEFKYTPTKAKIMTVTVTAVVELDGVEYTFSKDIELQVKDADSLVYIGIDASHYNEYVAGNYKDSMGNFGALAAEYGVRTVELKTSEDLIAACSNEKFVGIIFTAPSRRLAAAQSDPKTYSAEELAAIAAFNAAGGEVIVSGWADHYENYSLPESTRHMAATQNELLAALGSSIRLGDDTVSDDTLNGGDSNRRLYFNAYNFDSFLVEGVIVDPENPNDRKYSEVYSNYGGCSVFFEGEGVPATVTPIVYGHETTYIDDVDGDGKNELVYPYGDGNRVVALASEQLEGKGLIVVAGAAFMSNFEVQAQGDTGSTDSDQQMNYANYKICENLVKGFNEVKITPIAEVQAQTEIGLVYTIEGTVTSNASGYDKDTAFFDCIYVQDDTAGICCFPVSGNFKIGDKVRITGYVDFYQAELELQVMSISVIGETDPVEPKEVTAAQINDKSVLGSLVTLKGTVESFELENGLVQTILVKDEEGNIARVFIDGYITTAEDVKDLTVGCQIEATGLSSYDDTWKDTKYFPRIRIRDRADVVCTPGSQIQVLSYGKSLSLKGTILLNFYLEIPESLLADPDAYVMINTKKIPVGDGIENVINGKTYYRFYISVKSYQFTQDYVLRVYDGEEKPVKLVNSKGADLTDTGIVYSVKNYIENMRKKSSDKKLLDLVNALSDFGSLAQTYFKINADSAMEVQGDLDSVTVDSLEEYAAKVEKRDDMGLKYYGASLLYKSRTYIRFYFTLQDEDISKFTFTINGKTVTPVEKSGKYYIQTGGIAATNLDKAYHVEVSTGDTVFITVDYSALSYAYNQLQKSKDDDLKNLLKAMVLYNRAADAYFGS